MNVVHLRSTDNNNIVVPVFSDKPEYINPAAQNVYNKYLERGYYKGAFGEIKIHVSDEGTVCLLGLGEFSKIDFMGFRIVLSKAIEKLSELGLQRVSLLCMNKDALKVAAETIGISSYRFGPYREKPRKKVTIDTFELIYDDELDISESITLSEATNIARDLVNEPANVMTPNTLSEEIVSLGNIYGFDTEVWEEAKIREEKMNSFLAVGEGSVNRPRFIIMRYRGDEGGKTLGLVGKGVTYDSGGLSIKPTESMKKMKYDMGGAGAVVGTMCAVSKMKLRANVTAVIPACENLISGSGYRPGDIIRTRAGYNVFIDNTDAEGRLTLFDAIDYLVRDEGVDATVDIATLTGMCVVGLGEDISGVMTSSDAMYNLLEKSSEKSDESIWRLPLHKGYEYMLKTPEADFTNRPGRPAGAITAGMLLEKFAVGKPFMHIDIAGTANTSLVRQPFTYTTFGATGVGTRMLYHFIKEYDYE